LAVLFLIRLFHKSNYYASKLRITQIFDSMT